jgi:hypothetical protein
MIEILSVLLRSMRFQRAKDECLKFLANQSPYSTWQGVFMQSITFALTKEGLWPKGESKVT